MSYYKQIKILLFQMRKMERVISASKILAGVSNYTKWQDVMTNVLLKDDPFDVVHP